MARHNNGVPQKSVDAVALFVKVINLRDAGNTEAADRTLHELREMGIDIKFQVGGGPCLTAGRVWRYLDYARGGAGREKYSLATRSLTMFLMFAMDSRRRGVPEMEAEFLELLGDHGWAVSICDLSEHAWEFDEYILELFAEGLEFHEKGDFAACARALTVLSDKGIVAVFEDDEWMAEFEKE